VFFSSAGRMHSMQSGWMRPTTWRVLLRKQLRTQLRNLLNSLIHNPS
jgi:hypothetical protein